MEIMRGARRGAAGLVTAALAACGSDPGSPTGTGQVELRVATRAIPSSPSAGLTARITGVPSSFIVQRGDDVLEVSSAEIVLRKIELQGTDEACPDEGSLSGDPTDEDGLSEDERAECGGLRLAPTLLTLPLAGGTGIGVSAPIAARTYDELRFQIHRPTDDRRDAIFLQQHPGFDGISIRVTGTFRDGAGGSAAPFTFESDLTAVEDVSLPQPVAIEDDGSVSLTLMVDLSDWFVDPAGSGLIDPRTAGIGSASETAVEQQIRQSFHVFRDDDQDAAED